MDDGPVLAALVSVRLLLSCSCIRGDVTRDTNLTLSFAALFSLGVRPVQSPVRKSKSVMARRGAAERRDGTLREPARHAGAANRAGRALGSGGGEGQARPAEREGMGLSTPF